MESILCGLLGALSVALGMYIGFYMSKSKEKYPEVTFENSPMEVELKLIEK